MKRYLFLFAAISLAGVSQAQLTLNVKAEATLTIPSNSGIRLSDPNAEAVIASQVISGSGSVFGSGCLGSSLPVETDHVLDSYAIAKPTAGPSQGSATIELFGLASVRLTNITSSTIDLVIPLMLKSSVTLTNVGTSGFGSGNAMALLRQDSQSVDFGGTALSGSFDGAVGFQSIYNWNLSIGPGQSTVLEVESYAIGNVEVVPEPVTLALGALGLAAAIRTRRRS